MSRNGIPIDQADVDELVDICDENKGKSDEELAALQLQYLKSHARRYRFAKDKQKRPELRVIDGGRVD